MTQRIAILLTVYNRKECTLKCLQQIYSQNNINKDNCDIYIVDGGSNDGSVESIKESYPNVFIKTVDGLYWNRGMHFCWEWASKKDYDFYLWLNDDTYIYDDCIISLIEESLLHKNNSIIVGATQTLDHKYISYGGLINNQKITPSGDPILVESFNGNIVLIPKSVFYIVGNLDYKYIHSHGDLDYGLRARKLGIDIYQHGRFLGECNRHNDFAIWCNPYVSLWKRLKYLKKPNQNNPNELFYFERRHKGIFIAIFHFFTTYLQCIFPNLWIKLGKSIK